jgi:TRAP-type C4-dicarboxylate transport system permease small subunit
VALINNREMLFSDKKGEDMQSIYKTLKKIYENFSTALFVLIIFCVVLQVFARYVIQISLPWTEELARYTMIIASFLGAGTVSRKGDHLGVYFLRDKTIGIGRGIIYTFNTVVIIFVLGLMLKGTLQMTNTMKGIQASTMGWFYQSWLYMSAIVGTSAMLIYAIRDLFFAAKTIARKMKITETGNSSPFYQKD